MKRFCILSTVYVIVFLAFGTGFAQKEEKFHKEFDKKESVMISTVSGDCIIKQSSSDKIILDVVYSVRPSKFFEPDISERGNSLKIKERWSGSSSSGKVTWTLAVPPETEVEFSTASGDLSVEGVNNKIEANTASGDIEIENTTGDLDCNTASGDIKVKNAQGEMELNTASGEVDVKNSKGVFELSCASGDIDASNITIKEESSFSTASGDVEVKLAKSSDYDLELSAASGDVTLDYNGNQIKGFFEFTAKKRRGRISSPISFDSEEEFGRNGNEYVRKSFTKDGSNPKIYLETSSGTVKLKK